ncbi:hypothetical protein [Candidatus Hydrogenosomobacter endosymbioticus]|uniref:DNA-directed DNA polymerase n=1 Tax=Candidatus Hydrogenosomobacter endosymbioticus TaxID=2558174 RepID=A0ABN6L3H1_9PROT|nr:hypothetical protein [Candidatus Hydrogenosomobacter endosymbioticus]BDB96434.1 hypothetical protein HYD_5670 [Candidatus Hydrogenosomobacter endosymbioticus]
MKMDIADFIGSFPKTSAKAVLLYGGGVGLQNGLIAEIGRVSKLKTIDEDEFFNSFYDLTAPSLFFEPKEMVFVIFEAKETSLSDYIRAIADIPDGFKLVVTNSKSKTSSKMVRHFALEKKLLAIACYECSIMQSQRIFRRKCEISKIDIDEDALKICGEITINGSWNDLFQLLRLIDGGITKDILEKIISSEFPGINTAILSNNSADLVSYVERSPAQSDLIKMLRAWQVQLYQLIQLKALISDGVSESEAESKVRPAIFFKYLNVTKEASKNVSLESVTKALEKLILAEIAIKTGSKEPLVRSLMKDAISAIQKKSYRL